MPYENTESSTRPLQKQWKSVLRDDGGMILGIGYGPYEVDAQKAAEENRKERGRRAPGRVMTA